MIGQAGRVKALLWENAEPASSFSPTTAPIQLNDSIEHYDFCIMVFLTTTSDDALLVTCVFAGNGLHRISWNSQGSTNGNRNNSRDFILDGVSLSIEEGWQGTSKANNTTIPLRLYGVKL